jgi:DNA polymerase-3 subunit alpha
VRAREIIAKYQSIFGKENFFLELMGHREVEHYEVLKEGVKRLSAELSIPIVATWDSHYLHKEDKEAHNTLLAINTHGGEMHIDGDYHLISHEEAVEYFKDVPDAVENTAKVADMVDITLDLGKWVFPKFELESGEDADSQIRKKVYAGIPNRYGEINKKQISKMGE